MKETGSAFNIVLENSCNPPSLTGQSRLVEKCIVRGGLYILSSPDKNVQAVMNNEVLANEGFIVNGSDV